MRPAAGRAATVGRWRLESSASGAPATTSSDITSSITAPRLLIEIAFRSAVPRPMLRHALDRLA
jgi:hypothetical protein